MDRRIIDKLPTTIQRGVESEDRGVSGAPRGGTVARCSLRAGTTLPSAFPFPSSPYQASQPGLDLLLQAPKCALEALAEQGVEQGVDVRVQQHQPIREGNGRGRDQAGGQ